MIGFSVKYFTGHEIPKFISSGNTINGFFPMAIIGTMNFSLSVTTIKSYL